MLRTSESGSGVTYDPERSRTTLVRTGETTRYYLWLEPAYTLKKYGPLFRYLLRFEHTYGTQVLEWTKLAKPPRTKAIPLAWAELRYSLCTVQHMDGEVCPVQYMAVRKPRSAAAWYSTMDLIHVYPGRVMRDRFRRGMIIPQHEAPNDEATMTLTHTGMSRRMGTASKPSFALSPNHIAYIDSKLTSMFSSASTPQTNHDIACAGFSNLAAYLGWLRSSELFQTQETDITAIHP